MKEIQERKKDVRNLRFDWYFTREENLGFLNIKLKKNVLSPKVTREDEMIDAGICAGSPITEDWETNIEEMWRTWVKIEPYVISKKSGWFKLRFFSKEARIHNFLKCTFEIRENNFFQYNHSIFQWLLWFCTKNAYRKQRITTDSV